eukprot:6003297-Alexandrium_andersonii.AAC.1
MERPHVARRSTPLRQMLGCAPHAAFALLASMLRRVTVCLHVRCACVTASPQARAFARVYCMARPTDRPHGAQSFGPRLDTRA